MIIDAYTHCGLEKFRPFPEVQEMMAAVGIDRAVLVQHLGQYDNSYIAGCVKSAPDAFVGVAMIDATHPGAHDALAEVIDTGAFRGLRMSADMLMAAPAIASRALEAGLHVILYCPEGTEDIESVLPTLGAGPGRIVVTHLGSPTVEHGSLNRGRGVLRLVADERVMITLSGAGMVCDPPHLPLLELVRDVVNSFGPDRVMWASNFPVVGDAAAVAADLALVTSNSWGLSKESIKMISGVVAQRTWFDS
jgi:predicted TIM-barrel fold metal-dependent hydrolase